MLLGHTRLTLTSPAGYTLDDEGGVHSGSWDIGLGVDNRPGTVTRLPENWNRVDLDASLHVKLKWGTGETPRIIALLNVENLDEGTLITAKGASDDTLAYNAADVDLGYATTDGTRVQTLPDGSRVAYLIMDDDIDPIEAVWVEIHNDVNGSPVIASTKPGFGEIGVYQACNLSGFFSREWADDIIDPSLDRNAITGQGWPAYRRPWRVLPGVFDVIPDSTVFGSDAAPTYLDLQQLRSKLLRRQFIIVIPRWRDSAGDVDERWVYRTALFGQASKVGKFEHNTEIYWKWELEFKESPSPPAAS